MKPDPGPDNLSPAPMPTRKGFSVQDLRFHGRGPITFHLDPGSCVGLTGPSGVGKSLLLRALADLDPHHGTVSLDGCQAAAFTGPQWRRRVGFLPAASQWWHVTVADYFQGDWASLIAPSGLPADIGQWPIHRLSTGERQRLAILRLLSHHPHVLLLDEPTANLDRENAHRMATLIREDLRARQATALWVSHDLDLLGRVAHRRLAWRGAVLDEMPTGRSRAS